MNIHSILGSTIIIEAWAEVPDGWGRDEFAEHLRSLGNEVREFKPEIGPHGAFMIGVLTPQED